MPDILHTADVHLTPDMPDRLSALHSILTRAETLDVDAVTIGGDLFHDPADVESLRARLRNEFFTDREFDIIVIPGNHDRAGFRGNTHFGDACIPLLTEPFGHYILEDCNCRITGVPFVEHPDDELLLSLRNRDPFDGMELLLIHCTLDIGFAQGYTGEEENHRYFPITPQELATLEFDGVLAGHFHQPRHETLTVGEFVYPGTPISTSRRETGRRQVVIVDTDTRNLSFEPIDTFHYATESFTVLPGRERELFEEIQAWITNTVEPNTHPRITVSGFHGMDENTFSTQLTEAASPAVVTDETITAARIQAHPLFSEFLDRLHSTDWDEDTRTAVQHRTLEVFTHVWEDI